MASLATLEQLALHTTSIDVDAIAVHAQAMLDGASAKVRSYTGQQFTRTTTTERLTASRTGLVRLPQRPVHSVSAVAAAGGPATLFTWDGADVVEVNVGSCGPIFSINAGAPSTILRNKVDVTYDHGYDEIPDVIVEIVCNVALRAIGNPAEDGALTGEAITNYSYQRGSIGASGTLGLFAQEREELDRFRRPPRAISMR